jgi:RNA-directed DNA polymerase
VNIGEMQRKLSLWAIQDKSHKFFDLYHLLYDKDWLRLAHDYVKQNAGSKTAGYDGIQMSKFDENLESNLEKLASELKSETFQPLPVRRVYIPKADGKRRPLGIPSIRDRIVQEALRMILEPIWEADFSQDSFGFRPNRCTMDAIKRTAFCTLSHMKNFWVIEGDIESYFDTINHRKLMKLIRRRVKDRKMLNLIRKYLKAGVMEGKLFKKTESGTPQGGIISPLLANIYLNELDKYMERYTALSWNQRYFRRKKGLANFIHVRYADDFVILSNGTKRQAEAMKEEIYNFLKRDLRLELSKDKTKITHLNDGFKFLGFELKRSVGRNGKRVVKILIPQEAVRNVVGKIRRTTNRHSHQHSLNAKILALNRIIDGWCRYYQYTSKPSNQFGRVDYVAFWQLADWLGRKYRLSRAKVMRRFKKGSTLGTNQYLLTKATGHKAQIYRASTRKPNPYLMQEAVKREGLPQAVGGNIYWTGWDKRQGMFDLKSGVLTRDGNICQMCDKPVTEETARVDHIKPFRKFKRPVDANRLENLWTLCIECHKEKTKTDWQMESRMH